MTFCARIGQTPYASFALQTESSRAEQKRTAWVVSSFTDSVRHFYDYNEVTGRPLDSSCELFDSISAEIY